MDTFLDNVKIILPTLGFNLNEGGDTIITTKKEEKEIVKQKGNNLEFVDEYEFSSSFQAAAIILGYSVNGRVAWKNKNGKTLKDIEERKLKENGG